MRFLVYARRGTGHGFGETPIVHWNKPIPGQAPATDGTEYLVYDSESIDPVQALVNPHLKIELNKAGSLEFQIMPTHPLYDFFTRMKTYVRVVINTDEVFRGRVLNISGDTYVERTVECEGDLAYLVDSIQTPDQTEHITVVSDMTQSNRAARETVVPSQRDNMQLETTTAACTNTRTEESVTETAAEHFDRLLSNHDDQVADRDKQFSLGNITVTGTSTDVEFSATNYRDTKSAIDEDLMKYYGGFLKTRRSGSSVALDWLKNPGSTSTQAIRVGVNLISMQNTAPGDDIFTRLVPIGEDNLTIASVNNNRIYVQDDTAYGLYGAIYKVENFPGVTNAQKLLSKANKYIEKYGTFNPVTISVKALDMNLFDTSIDTIKLGSKVSVINPYNNTTFGALNYIISIEYDLQNPENNTYEIGDPFETLSERQKKKNQETASQVNAASTAGRHAGAAAADLTDSVNRHAENIIDIADKVYTLQANQLNVKADLIEIHARALEITATTVRLTADYAIIGNIIMGGNGDYELYLVGDTMLSGDLDVGGNLYCDHFEGAMYYTDGMMGSAQDIGSAILSFGEASASSAGVITIPYASINGDEGEITFNMASTAFYEDAVEAAWTAGGVTAYISAVTKYTSPITEDEDDDTQTVLTEHGQWYRIAPAYKRYDGTPEGGEGRTSGNWHYVKTPELNLETITNVIADGTYTPSAGYDGIGSITFDTDFAWNSGGQTAYVGGVTRNDPPSGTTAYDLTRHDTIYRFRLYYRDKGNTGHPTDNYYYAKTPAVSLQNKTKTSNGTVTADSGYDGLGTVTVNVPGPSSSDIAITGVTWNGAVHGSGTKASSISAYAAAHSSGYIRFTVSVLGAEKEYYIDLSG